MNFIFNLLFLKSGKIDCNSMLFAQMILLKQTKDG